MKRQNNYFYIVICIYLFHVLNVQVMPEIMFIGFFVKLYQNDISKGKRDDELKLPSLVHF